MASWAACGTWHTNTLWGGNGEYMVYRWGSVLSIRPLSASSSRLPPRSPPAPYFFSRSSRPMIELVGQPQSRRPAHSKNFELGESQPIMCHTFVVICVFGGETHLPKNGGESSKQVKCVVHARLFHAHFLAAAARVGFSRDTSRAVRWSTRSRRPSGVATPRAAAA